MKHPVLFNPYTGARRDVRDIDTDPAGVLIIPPGAEIAAETLRIVRERVATLNEAVHTFSFERRGPYLVRAVCACGWTATRESEGLTRAAHVAHCANLEKQT